ncbi:MAG TPA: hypothetical protein VLM79_40605 [Kofleriaceae bacterium]|nr:hypothetical protein [Kofleriaceae bacterium]
MSDGRPDDEDEHAWLLARERGEPGPAISEVRARHYAQLGTLIAGLPALPAGTDRRGGWEQAVLSAIDAEIGQPADQNGTSLAVVTDEPRAQDPTPTRRPRRRAAVAAAVCVMAAGVAIAVFMQRDRGEAPVRTSALEAAPEPPARSGSPAPGAEVTRGASAGAGRLGFDHVLQVRRSATADPHELRDGDTVMTGDRIRASVATSADAYVYLVFCAGRQFQMYPSQRGVRTKAGDVVRIPQGAGELVLDDQPGSEVLYLILSRNELSIADPSLASLIATTGDGSTAVDCGSNLDMRLRKSTEVTTPSNVLRGERIRASGSGAAIAADADGIAIVRYRFVHVASEPDPRASKGLR